MKSARSSTMWCPTCFAYRNRARCDRTKCSQCLVTLAEPAKKPKPKFAKGERVKIAATCIPYPGVYEVGNECTVRAVRWASGGGGQSAGWVCEVNILHQPGKPEFGFRTFWEHLLEKC